MTLSPPVSNKGIWFSLASLLLIIQYVRPQDFIPSLDVIRPYALVVTLLTACILVSGKDWFQTSHVQMRRIWLLVCVMGCLFLLTSTHMKTYETIRFFLLLIPFMLSVLIIVDDVKRLRQVVLLLTIMSVFIVCKGLLFHSPPGKGTLFLGNFLTDPNDYSLFMNMMLPFPFVWLSSKEHSGGLKKLLVFGLVVLIVLSIILSYSRGGLVGLVCVAITLMMFHPRRKTLLVGGVVLLLLTLPFVTNQWKDEMSTTVDPQSSTAQTRLVMWEGTLKAFIDKPIGIGPGNIPIVVYQYIDDGELGFNHERWHGSVAHSVWFTALAEWGIFGFLIFLNIIYLNFKDALFITRIRASTQDEHFVRMFGIACLGSLVGILSSGTFLTINYYPHFWYLTAFICACSKIVSDMHLKKKELLSMVDERGTDNVIV